MRKILLIFYISFFIFLPLQALGEGFCGPSAFGDLKLSAPIVKTLNEAGIHDLKDLRELTERGLGNTLQYRYGSSEYREDSSVKRPTVVERIKGYLSTRGESLARDFLVDDVGLSIEAANAFNRAGVHTVGDLYKLTERDLKNILPRENKRIGVKRIKTYFFSRRNYLVHGSVAGEDIRVGQQKVEALKKAGVYTVEDLHRQRWTESALFALPGLGGMTVMRIRVHLEMGETPLARDFLMDDVGLSMKTASTLRMAGVHTLEDLHKLTQQELVDKLTKPELVDNILPEGVIKVKDYLSSRGESLARDFLMDGVGLSVRAANDLRRAGIYDLEGLLQLTEWQLSGIFTNKNNVSKRKHIKKIKDYLASIE